MQMLEGIAVVGAESTSDMTIKDRLLKVKDPTILRRKLVALSNALGAR